jgi:hypothetical protein
LHLFVTYARRAATPTALALFAALAAGCTTGTVGLTHNSVKMPVTNAGESGYPAAGALKATPLARNEWQRAVKTALQPLCDAHGASPVADDAKLGGVQGRIASWAKALADEKAARESRKPNNSKVQANATLRLGDPDPRVVESVSFGCAPKPALVVNGRETAFEYAYAHEGAGELKIAVVSPKTGDFGVLMLRLPEPKGSLGVSYFVATNLKAYLPPDAGPPVVTPLHSLNHLYSFFTPPAGPAPDGFYAVAPYSPDFGPKQIVVGKFLIQLARCHTAHPSRRSRSLERHFFFGR